MQLLAHTMIMGKKIPTISVQISITPAAKKVVDDLAERTEIPQKRVLSKLYEWFAELPVMAQKSILWPEDTADEIDATRVALEYLEKRRRSLATPNSAGAGESAESLQKVQNLISQGAAANPDAPPKSPEEPPSPTGRHRVKQQSNK